MADIDLQQDEADKLMSMPKIKTSDEKWHYPGGGGSIIVPLTSTDRRDTFHLDISRARINLVKGRYQTRAKQILVLARLDFGGAPHRNPDNQEIGCPHRRLYKEGYGDKWAYPIPDDAFTDSGDPWAMLQDFMSYCNIVEPPAIERGLFA
jgi:hypothetical protein